MSSYHSFKAVEITVTGMQAEVVPVGDDQKAHIELARDIAARVNHKYGGRAWKKLGGRGGKLLTVPDVFMAPQGARVMSLAVSFTWQLRVLDAHSLLNVAGAPVMG